jgi:hypothetical protein
MKIEKNKLDLSGVTLQNLTTQEKKRLKRVREGYTEKAQEVLVALSKTSTLLQVPSVDLPALLSEADAMLQLQEALAWIDKKQELLEETLRLKQDQLKKQMDVLSDIAKPLSSQDQKLASIFADYWDFSAQPAKKAAATRRKKKNDDSSKETPSS